MRTVRAALVVGIALLGVVGLSLAQEIAPKPPSLPSAPRLPSGGPAANPPEARPGEKTGQQLVQVTATTDVANVKPGEKFNLAFSFTIEPGWHIYWLASGASGAPTEISVTGPRDFVIGKMRFPRPQMINTSEGPSYGYEGKVTLFVEVTAPHETSPGAAMFNAKLTWLVCKEKCLLGNASLMVSVNTGSLGSPATIDPVVSQFKKRLPQDFKALAGGVATCDQQNLTIRIPAQGFKTIQFFPLDTPGIEYGTPAIKLEGEVITATIPVTVKPGNTMGKPLVAAGLIGLGTGLDDPCYELEIPLAAP